MVADTEGVKAHNTTTLDGLLNEAPTVAAASIEGRAIWTADFLDCLGGAHGAGWRSTAEKHLLTRQVTRGGEGWQTWLAVRSPFTVAANR